MPKPLVCTTNSFGHTDYGIPIIASKWTDYRTSTGNYHQFIPNKPQEYDCRVKARVRPDLLKMDVMIRDDTVKSLYGIEYVLKDRFSDPNVKYGRPERCTSISYSRNLQEMIFKNPPKPGIVRLSEMKDMHRMKQPESQVRTIFPPDPYDKCPIVGWGRDEQPGIPPEQPGYWKHLDAYLTTNRAMHIPFTKEQQDGVARKDIMTYYDILNYPKAKGFGPKNGPAVEPLLSQTHKPIYDRLRFSKPLLDRCFSTAMKRVPNSGIKSEMKSNYTTQTYSDVYPYLHSAGLESVDFPDSLPNASAWENLAPPGMYCTEACHMGTGWPVDAVVDVFKPKLQIVHKPCFKKFCDDTH